MSRKLSFAEAVYAHFYRRRKQEAESRRVKFENVKIISVGNLTTGGTGKTPAVQWLVRRLQNEGVKVAVVGRGYGGTASEAGGVVSDGERLLLSAEQAGDEAVAHARALSGTPVVIGRDRVAAVQTAVAQFGPQAIVLDDAFQYWSLARDFDLVLMDAKAPFGNGKLLPLGRLREPKEELKRASGVLLTRADAVEKSKIPLLKAKVRRFTAAPVFLSRHRPREFYKQSSGEVISLQTLQKLNVAGASALANNRQFFDTLRVSGLALKSTLARRDHHRWRESEVRSFVSQAAKKENIEAIITTEKDAVKIRPEWCAPLPLICLRTELQIDDEAQLWELISRAVLNCSSSP